MSLLRRIVFYVFAMLYLLVCPLTVLYALGYLWQPGEEQGIVKTGVLYLATAPPGATVFLGEERFSRPTPAVVRSLLPAQYPVTVALESYRPWTRSLPVVAGKATVLDHILLLPEQMLSPELLSGPFHALAGILPEALLILERDQDRQLLAFSPREDKSWPLIVPGESEPLSALREAITVPGSREAVLRCEGSGGAERWIWLSARERPPVLKDITGLFPETPVHVNWDPRDGEELFVLLPEGRLSRVHVPSHAIFPDIQRGIAGFGVHNRQLYIVDQQFQLLRAGRDGELLEPLLTDSWLGQQLFAGLQPVDVQVVSDRIVFFLGSRGELLTNRLPYRLAAQGVRGLDVDPHKRWALVWDDARVGLIDLERRGLDESLFEQGMKVQWLHEADGRLRQAYWAYEGSHVLLLVKDEVELLERQPYGPVVRHPLVSTRADTGIVYLEEQGTLYYLDPEGRLRSLEIVPRRELLAFPEHKEPPLETPASP